MAITPRGAEDAKEVSFPSGSTTLAFIANANPAAAVNVTYTIRSPANVQFANAGQQEQLRGAMVGIDDTRIAKDVRFTFSGARPQVVIQVHGAVMDGAGHWLFDVDWPVPLAVELSGGPTPALTANAPLTQVAVPAGVGAKQRVSASQIVDDFNDAVMRRLDFITTRLAASQKSPRKTVRRGDASPQKSAKKGRTKQSAKKARNPSQKRKAK